MDLELGPFIQIYLLDGKMKELLTATWNKKRAILKPLSQALSGKERNL
jgi:hypothetical protein